MNPLELRKIVQIGYRFDEAPAWGEEKPTNRRYTATIAFWIPAPKPFRRCAGDTKVPGAYRHELQALKDGAIFEHVQDFPFEREPTIAEMARRLMPVWEGLTADSLGVPFNSVPLDTTTAPVFRFAATTPAPEFLIASASRKEEQRRVIEQQTDGSAHR